MILSAPGDVYLHVYAKQSIYTTAYTNTIYPISSTFLLISFCLNDASNLPITVDHLGNICCNSVVSRAPNQSKSRSSLQDHQSHSH